MKRSDINRYLAEAKAFIAQHHFCLPPWAFWSPAQWQLAGPEADEIRSRALGWDVTDFGSGDYFRSGLLLFTLRNGRPKDPANKKIYAEKLMVVRDNQVTPFHFHWQKTEDIINRGAGKLVCELYNATPDEKFADTPVRVSVDGIVREVSPGGKVILEPGESITLTPYLYHTFYAQAGHGTALIGEVSSVNDDATDNRFIDLQPRYTKVLEDQPPVHLLCTEYPPAKGGGA